MRMLNIPYNNYKTQRCKYYEAEGQCKFGKNCSYAHGENDLRSPYEALKALHMQNIFTLQASLNNTNQT